MYNNFRKLNPLPCTMNAAKKNNIKYETIGYYENGIITTFTKKKKKKILFRLPFLQNTSFQEPSQISVKKGRREGKY